MILILNGGTNASIYLSLIYLKRDSWETMFFHLLNVKLRWRPSLCFVPKSWTTLLNKVLQFSIFFHGHFNVICFLSSCFTWICWNAVLDSTPDHISFFKHFTSAFFAIVASFTWPLSTFCTSSRFFTYYYIIHHPFQQFEILITNLIFEISK